VVGVSDSDASPQQEQTLPSASQRALGKEFFLKKNSNFVKCQPEGTWQRFFFKKNQTLPSADMGHSAKKFILKEIKNLCRVLAGLALGKETVNGAGAVTVAFLCRVSSGLSAKRVLPINFLLCVLCRVPHSAKALPSAIWPFGKEPESSSEVKY